MLDSTERLIDLAFALAHAQQGMTRQEIRDRVPGYPVDQDDAAFARMFERDKKWLRGAGLAIETLDDERYILDAEATFASTLDLTPEEMTTLRAVGTATAGDPSFPFPDELRFALAKLATTFESEDTRMVVRTADESPAEQAVNVATLEDAITRSKTVQFAYVNAKDEHKQHNIEPYGLYFREGRWYVVGRDVALDAERTYAVARMSDIAVNTSKPETPDFERPRDFNVADAIALPFQYGNGPAKRARLRFRPGVGWRATAATAGKGSLREHEDGSVTWEVDYRSGELVCRWLIENGPGVIVEEPAELAVLLRERLAGLVTSHSGEAHR